MGIGWVGGGWWFGGRLGGVLGVAWGFEGLLGVGLEVWES